MGRRGRSREEPSQSDREDAAGVEVISISSDDEEANEDLTLEIVNKSMLRELKRKRAEDKARSRSFFEGLSASSAGEIVSVPSGKSAGAMEGDAAHAEEEVKKKRKKRLKKKKSKEVEEDAITEQPEAPAVEVDSAGTGDSVIEVVDEASNNLVLRKLLRGPRYFDSVHGSWESCYNCGEEGHVAANCKEERRQRPCFVCGTFGHTAKHCMQGQDCFICKRKGHHAKDCPHKHENNSQEPVICLRCGYFGHDMASCRNNYATGDIKEIQCYICKKYGHLCCVDYPDDGPNQISCYNCAEPGHAGQGCAKQRGENNTSTPSTLCYRCGEEGHFARGCTKHPKSSNRKRESSTPRSKDKKDKDSKVSKSLPKNFGRMHRKGSPYFDRSTKPVKSKVKGGWIVDDMVNPPKRTHITNDWSSPYTPLGRCNQNYSSPSTGRYSCPHTPSRRTFNVHPASSGGRYSSPYTPHQRYNYYPETPNSRGFTGAHHHGFSATRFGNSYEYYR
ncbi:hypothetical protein KSP40_PGU003296 [Platanthera guangdongensis]|uniref:CCHC-type domain-containing protein n=1 Tax=Platanthera guangdongensis TaxID=2320717 RepID=A0ABR2MXS3_9ASPA